MPYDLVHHDLVKVPLGGYKEPGIYWLRLYAGNCGYVAVVTEVPGNPGLSVTQAREHLVRWVNAQHVKASDRLVLYEVWPKGSQLTPSVCRVDVDDARSSKESSRSAIEEEIGTSLRPLPEHTELYARVLGLGGGVIEECWRRVYKAIRVSELPPPHSMHKCFYEPLFKELLAAVSAEHPELHWNDQELEAGRRFIVRVRAEDLARCPYHNADWRRVADESVRVIESVGVADDNDEYVKAARGRKLRGKDALALMSLFKDPIIADSETFTGGQHRGCALRFSGAERAAVVVDHEMTGEECTDWVFEGEW